MQRWAKILGLVLSLAVFASPLSGEVPALLAGPAGCHARQQRHASILQRDYQCCATGHNSGLLRGTFLIDSSFAKLRVFDLERSQPGTSATFARLLWGSSSGPPVPFPLLI